MSKGVAAQQEEAPMLLRLSQIISEATTTAMPRQRSLLPSSDPFAPFRHIPSPTLVSHPSFLGATNNNKRPNIDDGYHCNNKRLKLDHYGGDSPRGRIEQHAFLPAREQLLQLSCNNEDISIDLPFLLLSRQRLQMLKEARQLLLPTTVAARLAAAQVAQQQQQQQQQQPPQKQAPLAQPPRELASLEQKLPVQKQADAASPQQTPLPCVIGPRPEEPVSADGIVRAIFAAAKVNLPETELEGEKQNSDTMWNCNAVWSLWQHIPPVQSDITSRRNPSVMSALSQSDVLFGRGGLTNHYEGNIAFRTLIQSYRPIYKSARKGDKLRMARILCAYVRHVKGGRFLQREEKTDLWYEVGDEKAVAKCSQLLRERP